MAKASGLNTKVPATSPTLLQTHLHLKMRKTRKVVAKAKVRPLPRSLKNSKRSGSKLNSLYLRLLDLREIFPAVSLSSLRTLRLV